MSQIVNNLNKFGHSPLVKTLITFGIIAAGVSTLIAIYNSKRHTQLLKLDIQIRELQLQKIKQELEGK
jgi:hypothetical protein